MSILFVGCPAVSAAENSAATDSAWKLTVRDKDLEIYSRPHAGSSHKEFKAVGMIAAPSRAVCSVLDDFENYPKFMPFTTECRLVKQEGDTMIGYQRLSPKICADRDYTLRVSKKISPLPDGVLYTSRWSPANELGPPATKGVVRVNICEGTWRLEPDGPAKTLATYSIYTDSGGFMPSFLGDRVNVSGIRRLFTAIRSQVKEPKYAAVSPVSPASAKP
jgi:polyketide cyclase/dehydrase/lipid transport protein